MIAVAVSAGYFLAASRGLPQGVATFYASDLWPGLLLWLAASTSFVVVHTALWTGLPGKGRALRYLTAAVLMAVPPFGITGWAHPLTAAGVVFPGWGWWGLAAAAAGLLAMTTRRWPAAALGLSGFWIWSAATWTPATLPVGWKGVDLTFGYSLGREDSLDRHRALIATVREAAEGGARIVVLPESALGFWTPTVERLWRDGLRGAGATVLAGAAVVDGAGYDNVIVEVSGENARVFYRARIPVPVSMWRPWAAWTGEPGGARAHIFADSTATADGRRVAPLICYELLVVWPVLQSMLRAPDLIVSIGNGWWTAETSIVGIQRASAIAWARLFDRPLAAAFNM